jgi:hypothetical protein
MRRCAHPFTRGSLEPLGVTDGVVIVRYRATCSRCHNVVAQFDRSESLVDSESTVD